MKQSKLRTPEPIEIIDHPSKDRSDRFAVDALIRGAGWMIYRRKGTKALWCKQGRVLSQEQVLALLDEEQVWSAEHLECLYWEGVPSIIDLSSF